MIVVVGSGPAGVAAASALIDRGLPVTLLDAGTRLEPERAEALERLRALPPSRWHGPEAAFLRDGAKATARGVPEKRAYGSRFPYETPLGASPLRLEGVGLAPSFARGGHSRVWGGAILPWRDADLRSWPLSRADLAPHYEAVLRFVPRSSPDDDLSSLFPDCPPSQELLPPNQQGRDLLEHLGRHRERLRRAGVQFGGARLAVRAGAGPNDPGCVRCGHCLRGCPYGLIWSADQALPALEARGLTYEPGVLVERVEEGSTQVRVIVRAAQGGEERAISASRVLVAAGVLSTTRIALASLGQVDAPVTLKGNQYFMLPWLRARSAPRVSQEEHHTLAQVFLELLEPGSDRRGVHLQIYGYNDLYWDVCAGLLGPLAGALRAPTERLLGRLHVVQGYLHSDVSSRLEVTLRRDGELVVRAQERAGVRGIARAVVARLARLARPLGGMPVAPLLTVGPPGLGAHVGGAFPMRRRPRAGETDLLGRPAGWERLHLVDATCLPSIPATTITLTAMANAHRIATELPA